jgi:hypothetical protein
MGMAVLRTEKAKLENRDDALRRVMTHGPLFGIPSVFLASMAVAVGSGVPLGTAAVLSVVPAVAGGPYFGGLAVMFHLQLMEEAPHPSPKHSFRRHHRPSGMKTA